MRATIAQLHEELNLTAAFTGAMVRMGNYRAALGVVEEQRQRVHALPASLERAAHTRRKTRAAIAGLAAAALLGSGALAAWVSPDRSDARTVERIELGLKAIDAAQVASSSAVIAQYIDVARTALTGIDPRKVPPHAPLTPEALEDVVRLLQDIDGAGRVGGKAVRAIEEIVRKVAASRPDPKPQPPVPQDTPNSSATPLEQTP